MLCCVKSYVNSDKLHTSRRARHCPKRVRELVWEVDVVKPEARRTNQNRQTSVFLALCGNKRSLFVNNRSHCRLCILVSYRHKRSALRPRVAQNAARRLAAQHQPDPVCVCV
jgi:hypothetical protein